MSCTFLLEHNVEQSYVVLAVLKSSNLGVGLGMSQ